MTDTTPQKQERRPHEEPRELELGETDAGFEYAVHYQDERHPDTWLVMAGRSFDEGFRNVPPGGGRFSHETTSMDEAVEIAEALVQRRSYPDDPTSRHYSRVLRARVVTRVSVAAVSALYGEPRT